VSRLLDSIKWLSAQWQRVNWRPLARAPTPTQALRRAASIAVGPTSRHNSREGATDGHGGAAHGVDQADNGESSEGLMAARRRERQRRLERNHSRLRNRTAATARFSCQELDRPSSLVRAEGVAAATARRKRSPTAREKRGKIPDPNRARDDTAALARGGRSEMRSMQPRRDPYRKLKQRAFCESVHAPKPMSKQPHARGLSRNATQGGDRGAHRAEQEAGPPRSESWKRTRSIEEAMRAREPKWNWKRQRPRGRGRSRCEAAAKTAHRGERLLKRQAETRMIAEREAAAAAKPRARRNRLRFAQARARRDAEQALARGGDGENHSRRGSGAIAKEKAQTERAAKGAGRSAIRGGARGRSSRKAKPAARNPHGRRPKADARNGSRNASRSRGEGEDRTGAQAARQANARRDASTPWRRAAALRVPADVIAAAAASEREQAERLAKEQAEARSRSSRRPKRRQSPNSSRTRRRSRRRGKKTGAARSTFSSRGARSCGTRSRGGVEVQAASGAQGRSRREPHAMQRAIALSEAAARRDAEESLEAAAKAGQSDAEALSAAEERA